MSTALVLGVSFLIGSRPSSASEPGWLAALSIQLAFALAVSWLSAAVGLPARARRRRAAPPSS